MWKSVNWKSSVVKRIYAALKKSGGQNAPSDLGIPYVRQDRSGNLQDVEIRNCKTDYSSNSQTFKDSVMRAVYKSAPLPSAPNEAVFESEILFIFSVN